jgi:hypothetical protein
MKDQRPLRISSLRGFPVSRTCRGSNRAGTSLALADHRMPMGLRRLDLYFDYVNAGSNHRRAASRGQRSNR